MAKEIDKDVPAGFDINVGRELGDGWVIKAPGVKVQGRLMGRFIGNQEDDDGNKQAFYQIRLDIEVKATRKNRETDKNEEVVLKPGDLLNVGEHKALEELAPYCKDGGVYDVFFMYVEEQKVPRSSRTFWVIKGPKLAMRKAPKVVPDTSFPT